MAQPLTRIPTFFAELRRRKVIRVAIAYGIVAFGVTEVSNNVFPNLGVEWLPRIVVWVLLLGFPVALVLAWAFDITSTGIERTSDSPLPPAPNPLISPSPKPVPTTISTAPRHILPEGSIAPLPFANLSGDAAQDYLSEGLTEELIIALSRVPGVRVAARTSCFAAKGSHQDVREIGQRLGVRHVLDGGVRVANNWLRLSAQLVDVETGFVEWSETYERKLDDIFAVQQEIAEAIVRRVAADRRGAPAQVGRSGTESVEAFKLYLLGRYHWNRRTETDLRRATDFFEQAVALDRGYGAAYAGLADAFSLLLDYGGMAPAEGLGRARDAAERALRIDPGLAEAYTSLALVRQFEYRWSDAETAFMKSIELRPDYSIAHQRYSLLLAWLGRHDEAVAEAQRAESLDPLAVFVAASAGWVLYYGRRFDQARSQLERALGMDAHFATARIPLALALLNLGDTAAAVYHLERAVHDSGNAASTIALHAHALVRAGRVDKGRELLRALEQRAQQTYVSSYYLALPVIALGDTAGALDRLEAAHREHAAQLAYIAAEPLLDPLRSDARFKQLLRKTGLTP
jgi:serine/threonine-protein kinase